MLKEYIIPVHKTHYGGRGVQKLTFVLLLKSDLKTMLFTIPRVRTLNFDQKLFFCHFSKPNTPKKSKKSIFQNFLKNCPNYIRNHYITFLGHKNIFHVLLAYSRHTFSMLLRHNFHVLLINENSNVIRL